MELPAAQFLFQFIDSQGAKHRPWLVGLLEILDLIVSELQLDGL